MPDESLYLDRPQTYIKHLVLERYLQKLTYKLGWYGGVLNFVDCFSGPWREADEELRDTSPFVAIKELREARDRLRELSRPELKVRALFIEKDAQAWSRLTQQLRDVLDVDAEH